nr:retrovirus-related Pol polyprotein from transposon TNT 1-94 [Tanacetum cinerariifolium]
TDDYSRFTWVFFLATKDETSPILKTFIIGLENQLSLKVKVIRSDNGTKFKNSDVNQSCGMMGIKREFNVPRTPQQNGIAERKNRTLIEPARTTLADSLLPIPFWAEAVNTACYVQNRVLVTKPHNKTPYELLHGRTPSIGFMRPFSFHVTILNTLDPLSKFKGKVDKGFLVGYSVSSKAFRVFNSRTSIVQETLHVIFLENKPNIAGEEINQQYVLFPVWSFGSTNPHNYDGDATFDEKEHDAKKPESEVNVSLSSSTQSRKQHDKTSKEAKGKSHVKSFTRYRDLSAEFQDCSENSSNEVNVLVLYTNPFSAAGPSNITASPTHGQSSFKDASQPANDPDMPELEDITYSDDDNDVGAEAGFNNLGTSITLSLSKPAQNLSYTNRPTTPIIKDWVSDSEDESETIAPQIVPSFVQSSKQVKPPRHFVQPVETSILTASPKPKSPKSISSSKRRNRKTCFVCKSVDHLIKNYDYHAKKMAQPTHRNYTHRGNMSYLSDFEELNGGYVAFGGYPKGGKISGKGNIKTCKLDFDDVYFVKELKFNLFSVS